jgi:hypothetical protein
MLLWADNFENYGTGTTSRNNMLDGLPYIDAASNQTNGAATSPDGSGELVLTLTGSGTTNLDSFRLAISTPGNLIGMGARFWRPTLPASNSERPVLFSWRSSANGRRYDLLVEPNGALGLYNNSSTLIEGTVIPIFTAASFQHIEARVDCVTGEYEVRREGVVVLEGTDPSPPGGVIGIVGMSNHQNTFPAVGILYMKDLVVWDDTGTENNDFFGSVSVVTQSLLTDNSNSGWVASTGSSIAGVLDETTPNDADYATAALINADVEMTLEDLPTDVTSVRGIITIVRAKKSDGGDGKLQISLKSNASYDAGIEHPLTTTETYHYDISELDPNTGTPWTPGTFNDASLRMKRTL